MVVGNTIALYWYQGEPVFISINNEKELTWKIGIQRQVGKTLSWDVGQISKSIAVTWQIAGTGIDNGNPKATYWAKHTGEGNSGQVIRFRSAADITNIVWESAVERNPIGQIQVFVGWEKPTIQDKLKVTQTIYSDWKVGTDGLPNGSFYNVIRPDVILSNNILPFYVFHEYASTTDPKYIIRYLGYMNSPFEYYNGPKRPNKIEDIVAERGVAVFPTNYSGKTLNVTIRFRDGSKISGMLPPQAAIAVVKKDDNTYQVGHVLFANLPVYAGSNVMFDADQLKSALRPFQ